MKTIKKYTRGILKGWNIRQLNDGYYVPYIGITSQLGLFQSFKECEDWIKNHIN